ncbi:MAG: cytochrome P450 [Planctomycetota bacterium]
MNAAELKAAHETKPSRGKPLPPGPKSLKFFNTMKVLRNPRAAFERWVAEYGDPFFVHALNGPIVVTGRPELIREVFAQDTSKFEVFGERAIRPMLGPGSMLMLDGEKHRRERKLVMPMFHGSRMKAYGDIIRTATLDAMEAVADHSSFEMISVSTDVSLKVIAQAILGGDCAETIDRLTSLARETIERSLPILFFSPRTQIPFMGISPWDRFTKARRTLREAFDDELERREKDPQPREDILTMLLDARYDDGESMSKEHLYDELGTFLMAGHETTAISLAWAIYFLLTNPEPFGRLKHELAACDASDVATLATQPYLKAVVSETLRLNPIVTEVLRVLRSPMELGEYEVPAGFAVAPAAALTHYREELYPEPDCFRPDRFLNRQYSSSEYLPFGGGTRRCAGAAFALYELAIALGTIVTRFELELLEKAPVVPKRRNVVMGPSTGVRVRVTEKFH